MFRETDGYAYITIRHWFWYPTLMRQLTFCLHIQQMGFVHKILFGKKSKFSITAVCFFSNVSESSNAFCIHFLSDRCKVVQKTVHKFLAVRLLGTNVLISAQLIHSFLLVCISVQSILYIVWVIARTTVFSSRSTRPMARCLFLTSSFATFIELSYSVHYRLHNTKLLLTYLHYKS